MRIPKPVLLTAILAGVFLLPPNASAQVCGTIHNCGPVYDHVNEWEQAGGNHALYIHEDCISCTINFEAQPWFYCHPPCEDETLTAKENAAYEAVLAALRDDDLKGVAAALPSLAASTVQFNASRQAVQVLDCRGAVVAHLPLTLDRAFATAAREMVNAGKMAEGV